MRPADALWRPPGGLARSSALVSASLLATTAVSLAQSLALVLIAGDGAQTDAFLGAYSLYLPLALAASALRTTLVPVIRRGGADSTELTSAAEAAVGRVVSLAAVGTVTFGVCSLVAGPFLLAGLAGEARETLLVSLAALTVAGFMQAVASALSAVLAAAGRFGASSLIFVTSGATGLGVSIVGLVVFGPRSVAFGVLASGLLACGLHLHYLSRFRLRVRPRVARAFDRGHRRLARELTAATALSALMQVAVVISLAGLDAYPGAITAYSYAFFFVSLALNLSFQAIGMAALPALSDEVARSGSESVERYLLSTAPVGFAVAAPLCAGFAAFGQPALRWVFGSVMDPSALDRLYHLGLVCMIMAVPYGLFSLVNVAVLARRRLHAALLAAGGALAIQAALVWAVSDEGPAAVALAHLAAAVVTVIVVGIAALGGRAPWLLGRAILRSMKGFAAAAAIVPFGLVAGVDASPVLFAAMVAAATVTYLLLLRWSAPEVLRPLRRALPR